MPYANKKTQKKFMARQYTKKYATDDKFKKAESDRKADWYQRNREKVIARVLENRAKKTQVTKK
jgi:hypothetical protein